MHASIPFLSRMLREKPELFFPVCYSAPQYYTPWQASSTFVHHQVPSQHYTTGYVTLIWCAPTIHTPPGPLLRNTKSCFNYCLFPTALTCLHATNATVLNNNVLRMIPLLCLEQGIKALYSMRSWINLI